MIRGWLTDHDWRLPVLSAGFAVATLLTGQAILVSPLGESYQGVTVGLFAILCSSAGFALSLRSRIAAALNIRAGARYRLLWFVAQLLVVAIVAESVAGLHLSPRRLVFVVGWGAGMAGLLALGLSEAAAALYVFLLFAACMLTPRGEPAPWWNPLLHVPGGGSGVVSAAILLLACGAIYVANPLRHSPF